MPTLSPRQIELLGLLAAGHTCESAATAMCISHHTARSHIRMVRARLQSRTIAEAVARAITLRLISLNTPDK